MLILRGSPALSSFRLQKLQAALVADGLPVRALAAEFVHLAETTAPLSPAAHSVLSRLLTVVYFLFFLLMPWYSSIDKTKPVPTRVTYHAH